MAGLFRKKNTQCDSCGDLPLNHRSIYLDTSATAFFNDWMQILKRPAFFGRMFDMLRLIICLSEPHLMHVFHILSGLRTNTDMVNVRTTRAEALWIEARRRGIYIEQLVFFGIYSESFRVRRGKHWVYFENLPIPPRLLAGAFAWTDDKLLFKQFLIRNQIPCAPGLVSKQLKEAKTLYKNLQLPLVVKPRIGTNSRHTTPYVHTDTEFVSAFNSAHELCREVLFEEYLYGHLCRATVVDGKLIGFLESKQPVVIGDGIHSVAKLIEKKNSNKHSRVAAILDSQENKEHIQRQGFTMDSILELGKEIQVSRLPGRLTGGQTRELPLSIHPKLRHYIEKTARLLAVPVVGFDLIIQDPMNDPDSQKWGILEANTIPFIEIHQNPLYGESSNVAAAIWDLWEKKRD